MRAELAAVTLADILSPSAQCAEGEEDVKERTVQECRSWDVDLSGNRCGNRLRSVCCGRTNHAEVLAPAMMVERFRRAPLELPERGCEV